MKSKKKKVRKLYDYTDIAPVTSIPIRLID